MSREATIYGLCEPGTDVVRYVGQTFGGVKKRVREHYKQFGPAGDWIRELKANGQEPNVIVFCVMKFVHRRNQDVSLATAVEKFLITHHHLCCPAELLNRAHKPKRDKYPHARKA